MVERFKELLRVLGISQKALAEAAGVHPNSLTEFAKGRTKTLSQEILVYLNTEYSVSLNWLVYGRGKMFGGYAVTSKPLGLPDPVSSLARPERKVIGDLIALLANRPDRSIVSSRQSEEYSHSDLREVGLVASIAAGNPMEAIEHPEEIYLLPRKMFKRKGKLFLLRVRGDSMTGAAILDGDLAVMERVEDAEQLRNGEIVAISLDGAATLKRFLRDNGSIILRAENKAYPDRVVTAREFPILWGRFVGLVRREVES